MDSYKKNNLIEEIMAKTMKRRLIQTFPALTANLTPIFAPAIKLIARIIPKMKSILPLIVKIMTAIIERMLTMNRVIPALWIKLFPKYEMNIKVNMVEIPPPKKPP